ncbi:MAG: hypothetical protein ACR2ML_03520 [Solirubrobacteraceae bacterium]
MHALTLPRCPPLRYCSRDTNARSARKALAGGRGVRATIKASFKDADGGTATRSEKVTLKRSRR